MTLLRHGSARPYYIVACLASLASLAPCATLSAQNVLSQAATFDTALMNKTSREHSAQFPSAVVVFDPTTRTASVAIENKGTAPLTLNLRLESYKITSDTGRNIVAVVDSHPTRSLAAWVHGLPEHVTIAPGATQTIKLTVTPPAKLEPGEYSARIAAEAPTVQQLVPAVVRAIMDEGPGVEPALVQQPTTVNFTMTMLTYAKLVYRQGPASSGVTLSKATATLVPATGQVRVCGTYTQTGTVPAMANARFAVVTEKGTDSLVQNASFEVQGTQDGCLTFLAFGLKPGTHNVSLAINDERSDIAKDARVAVAKTKVTLPLEVPPGTTPTGPLLPPAPRVALSPNAPIVELMPGNGSLSEQLKREAQQAAKDGKIPFVEIGASWCGPCQAFLQALSDTAVVSSLKDARVIRVDFDRWGTDFLGLSAYKFPASLPTFFTLNTDGSQGTWFNVDERWGPLAQQYGGLDARAMAPSFKTFFTEVRAKGGAKQ